MVARRQQIIKYLLCLCWALARALFLAFLGRTRPKVFAYTTAVVDVGERVLTCMIFMNGVRVRVFYSTSADTRRAVEIRRTSDLGNILCDDCGATLYILCSCAFVILRR